MHGCNGFLRMHISVYVIHTACAAQYCTSLSNVKMEIVVRIFACMHPRGTICLMRKNEALRDPRIPLNFCISGLL